MSQNFQSRKELVAEIERLKYQIDQMENARSSSSPETETSALVGDPYRNLFEQAGDSIFIVDPDSLYILTTNENGARRLGYTVDELLKLRFSDIEIKARKELIDTKTLSWESTMSGVIVYESAHRKKDGTTIPVEVSSSLIHLDGNPVIQNIVRDVTQRKLIEQHNREIFLERERVKLLSSFIEQASHQFRTPLSIINTNGFLLSKTDDMQSRERQAESIKTQVDHISRLVDGLITLSTLAEKQGVELAPLDMTQKLRMLIDKLRQQVASRQIDIHFEIEDTPLMVNGNWENLELAFQQLLDNAIRSIESQGEILVRVTRLNEDIAVEIHDTGKGIHADDIPNIFATFFRADKAGTTRGLGLGLSIVKLVVDIHRGIVEVESDEGKGSMFRVLLPLAN